MEKEDQYSIQWAYYSENMKKMFVNMLTQDTYSDITLVCDDQVQYKSHKFILSSSSSVFQNILSNTNNNPNPLVYLKGIKSSEMESLLQFIYLGQASLVTSRVKKFLEVAKEFNLEGLDNIHDEGVVDENLEVYEVLEEDLSEIEPLDTSEVVTDPYLKERILYENTYTCQLKSCQKSVSLKNVGSRSAILNHYTNHFQSELENSYGHLIIKDTCKLCKKDLSTFVKTKRWIHIGVTHNKTNEILSQKGIKPIDSGLKMKRKSLAEDPLDATENSSMEEEISTELPETPEFSSPKSNTCSLCGHMNQNRKRLLKHLSTQHFHDQLLHDLNFFEGNKCIKCGKDFTGAKKSSKRIHVGVYHMQAMELYEEKYGTSPFNVKWNKAKNIEPIKKEKLNSVPDAENRLQKIAKWGNECLICKKEYQPFRSTLLPHYAGHFYKKIADGHENYFRDSECLSCPAKLTQRKSKIIHLAVSHNHVLPYIENLMIKQES